MKFGGLSLLLGTYGDVLPLAVISHFILSKKEGLLQPKLGLQINLASTGTLSSAAMHLFLIFMLEQSRFEAHGGDLGLC